MSFVKTLYNIPIKNDLITLHGNLRVTCLYCFSPKKWTLWYRDKNGREKIDETSVGYINISELYHKKDINPDFKRRISDKTFINMFEGENHFLEIEFDLKEFVAHTDKNNYFCVVNYEFSRNFYQSGVYSCDLNCDCGNGVI